MFSILDQKQKQAIPFQNGCIIGDYEGKLFVASNKDVYGLIPLPVEKQVYKLSEGGWFLFFFKEVKKLNWKENEVWKIIWITE